jgi:hypothetical protein
VRDYLRDKRRIMPSGYREMTQIILLGVIMGRIAPRAWCYYGT